MIDTIMDFAKAIQARASGATEAGIVDRAVIDAIAEHVGREPRHLVALLRAIQSHYRYLPVEALEHLAAVTGLSPAAITGVATFYPAFRLRPAGLHTVRVCVGTACHVKGAETVYHAFRHCLGIPDEDDTDAARLFTVEKVACLGCCMLAPAVQIDDITYGFVEPRKVERVLHDFLSARKADTDMAVQRSVPGPDRGEVRLCICSSCAASGAVDVRDEMLRQIHLAHLPVTVKTVGCTGESFHSPLVEITEPRGQRFRYGLVQPVDVRSLLLRHFTPRHAVYRACAAVEGWIERVWSDETWDNVTRYPACVRPKPNTFCAGRQVKIVTEHAGEMDPLDIDDYIAHGGFEALNQCVLRQAPEETIRRIATSGLRGRGGAGFPTARKWQAVHEAGEKTRYVICNGDEGDPGAFMDRMILESFPFRVIEGFAIAASVVGAHTGFFYIRSEYPLAVQRMCEALRICEERGFIGDNVCGSGHALRAEVVEGAGAFVCGEETALIAAIEGGRGMPRYRPPYPAEQGLWGKPTLVNNVETLGAVPWIIRHGSDAFVALGSPGSSGTKTFALAGKVLRGGLIEVPMGTTVRQIVDELGGGLPKGRSFKAVQIGGPSGGCLPAALADTPVDYESLRNVCTMMGSGGMIVLDDTDCMVDVARYFLAFTQKESCGKCTYCRIGTRRMLEILESLCCGTAAPNAIAELEHLSAVVAEGSLCGLGRTAPNPVLSTLRYFRAEYEAHLVGHCPARVCKALIRYTITDDCIGCTRCAQRCPVEAIAIRPYERHEIDDTRCVGCDTCRQACPVDAVRIEDRPPESGERTCDANLDH
jgi:NADH-quinone oxidoreductase subunit F